MALVGVLQTVPSLALFAMLIPLLGRIGTVPALVALALYALLPIVRNTTTGLSHKFHGRGATCTCGVLPCFMNKRAQNDPRHFPRGRLRSRRSGGRRL